MEYKEFGKTGIKISAVGQGTMGIGGYFQKDLSRDDYYIKILKTGIDLGMTFIDTAECYGEGHSEELVGKAIINNRDNIFISSKVSPENLSYPRLIESAESSLRRMQIECIDLYQIHWPNPTIPIEETLKGMQKLIKDGKIRYIGLSNFTFDQIKLIINDINETAIVSIQNEYNLFDRTVENEILPFCHEKKMSLIAYSPLDHGNKFDNEKSEVLLNISQKYYIKPMQLMLRWLTSKEGVFAIPKSAKVNHIKDNAVSTDFILSKEDIKLIDNTFRSEIINIPVDLIKSDKKGLDSFVPKPEELAKIIKTEKKIKPVRVHRIDNSCGKYKYNLTEGKLRFWAWVIAFNGKAPIQALVR
ncbi:aldo/keto reductase [candidate division KSB1 bacterium]